MPAPKPQKIGLSFAVDQRGDEQSSVAAWMTRLLQSLGDSSTA